MVLAGFLALVATVGPHGWQEPQAVPIAPRVLGTFAQMVEDPSNPGKSISAQVKITLSGELRPTPIGDSVLIGGRSAQVRVDVSVAAITSENLIERLPNARGSSLDAILRTIQAPNAATGEALRGVLSDTSSALGRFAGTQRVDPNTNLRPGGWTIREYGSRNYGLTANYQIDREYSIGGVPRKLTTALPAIEWGSLTRLDVIPTLERFIPDPKPGDVLGEEQIEVLRGWGGGSITGAGGRLEGLGYLPLGKLEYPLTGSVSLGQYGRDALGGILNITGKPIISPELLGSVNGQSVETLAGTTIFSGEDMNRLGYEFRPNSFPNCTGTGDSYFPTGTLWWPDKPGYQVMSNYQPVQLHMNFSPFAEIDPAAYVEGEFRTHCMNMAMKEPAKGVRYFPYKNPDPVAAGLMDLTSNSRVRGPWDQARLWIYTNKVGIDEINDRLMLGVSPAQYLTSIKQIAGLGGLAAKDYSDKKLFVPKLLAGRGMGLSTLAWGFGVLEGKQPKELGSWLAGFPEEMGKLLGGDKADKEHLAGLFQHSLDSEASEVRLGALKALLKKPQGYEALSGNLGSMHPSLLSTSAAEVESALDALAAYGGTGPKDVLTYLADNGANAKIKQKAKGLLGG